jgi:transcriptional regulator with XRE-family HTH domain
MICKKALGERLRVLENAENLSGRQVALKIGADVSYYNKARNGNGLSQEYLDNLLLKFGLTKRWLVLGEGEMYLKKRRNGKHAIPLLDAGAIGKRQIAVDMRRMKESVEVVDATEYKDATGAMYVCNDTCMAPKYKAKDKVVFKKVTDLELILYGADYIIQTNEFCILRNVQKAHSKGNILSCSYNMSTWKSGVLRGRLMFEPFEIPIKKITALYLVLGKL